MEGGCLQARRGSLRKQTYDTYPGLAISRTLSRVPFLFKPPYSVYTVMKPGEP